MAELISKYKTMTEKKGQKFSQEENTYAKKIDEDTNEITLVKTGTRNVYEDIQAERDNCMELKDAIEIVNGEMVARNDNTRFTTKQIIEKMTEEKMGYGDVTGQPNTLAELGQGIKNQVEAKKLLDRINETPKVETEKPKVETETPKVETETPKVEETK